MRDYCKLCKQQKELLKSHIIPSFVYRWLKESSVTGHFRCGETTNQRVQDGIKTYLLCGDCEQLLGVWENTFAKEVFIPFHTGSAPNIYGPWLLNFSVSISWRILTYFKYCHDLNHFPDDLLKSVDNALNIWQEFLIGKRSHPDIYEQHMVPFSYIVDRNDPELPSNFNQYVSRSIDIDAVCSKTHAYVYAKMCRILLIGFIKIDHRDRWSNTKIHVNKGSMVDQRYKIPKYILDFMYCKANKLKAIQRTLSDRQWDKIDKDYRMNSDKFPNSEMFNAITQDYILFGDDAFNDVNSDK